jgi:hypothetical protein
LAVVGNACDGALGVGRLTDPVRLVKGLQKVAERRIDVLGTVRDGVSPRWAEIPLEPDEGSVWETRHGLAHHGRRRSLVADNDLEPSPQRAQGTRVKAGRTDKGQ